METPAAVWDECVILNSGWLMNVKFLCAKIKECGGWGLVVN